MPCIVRTAHWRRATARALYLLHTTLVCCGLRARRPEKNTPLVLREVSRTNNDTCMYVRKTVDGAHDEYGGLGRPSQPTTTGFGRYGNACTRSSMPAYTNNRKHNRTDSGPTTDGWRVWMNRRTNNRKTIRPGREISRGFSKNFVLPATDQIGDSLAFYWSTFFD